jgi:hypothetical protein
MRDELVTTDGSSNVVIVGDWVGVSTEERKTRGILLLLFVVT